MIKNHEDFANEIEDNDEEDLLKSIWFYHFKHAKKWLKGKGKNEPRSQLLKLVLSIKSLIKSHCQTSMMMIKSLNNAESFIDEYNIRVSLIHASGKPSAALFRVLRKIFGLSKILWTNAISTLRMNHHFLHFHFFEWILRFGSKMWLLKYSDL